MERLLARLERRFGGLAVPNLTAVVVAGMAMVYVMGLSRPSILAQLTLDFDEVRAGQVWRLVTYMFLPVRESLGWFLISLLFLWWVGSTLEEHWGAFRFNLFYVLGWLGTTLAAALTGTEQTNVWIIQTLTLALGTLFPDEIIRLYFFIPVKAKWLAVLVAVFMGYSLIAGDAGTRGGVLGALSGYLVCCGPTLVGMLRSRQLGVRQAARRAASAPAEVTGHRMCVLCGASEADGADIRVCSCAKCGGPRHLCLHHARNH